MIINKLASLLNTFLVNLFEKNIHFYQILIGLFIFNFIIYSLCRLLKIMKNNRYGGF